MNYFLMCLTVNLNRISTTLLNVCLCVCVHTIHNNNSCKEPVRLKTTSVALVSANDIDTTSPPGEQGPAGVCFHQQPISVFPAQLSHLSSNLSINNLSDLEQLGHIPCFNYNQNYKIL